MTANPRPVCLRAATALASVLAITAPCAAQTLFSTPTFTQVDAGVPFQTRMPRTATIDDFNADGLPDVAIAEDTGIRIVLGDGAGGFTGFVETPLSLAGAVFPQIVGSPDLNLDGFPDLVVMSLAMHYRVHLNDGSCGFAFSTPIPVTSPTNSCCGWTPVFADLDGIPPVEMIARDYQHFPNHIQEYVRIYSFNVATSSFRYSQAFNLPIGEFCGWITCGDFNGDSLIDITYVTYIGVYPTPPTVWMRALANQGNGAFVAPPGSPWSIPPSTGCGTCSSTFPCSPSLGPMLAKDVTGDGIDDLVAFGGTHYTLSGCYSIWIFNGSPFSLLVPPVLGRGMGPGNFSPGPFVFADVDDDANVDFAWGLRTARVTPVFGVDTTTTVNIPVLNGYCNGSLAEAVGDMNLDGAPDVVVATPRLPAGSACPTYVGTALNLSRRAPACGSSSKFFVGTPNPGNPAYSLTLSSNVPNAAAILGVSLAEGPTPVPGCVLGLDVSPANLILPDQYGFGVTSTNFLGTASFTFTIPAAPALVGLQFYSQWIFRDPAGPIQLGGFSWSSTFSRRVLVW